MQKQAPTIGKLAMIAVFALSCFLILTYLWTSFGGPTPISAKGYRFQADFDEATQLADNADVRISGVTVGHVKKLEQVDETTRVEIEIGSSLRADPAGHAGDAAAEDAARRDIRRAVAGLGRRRRTAGRRAAVRAPR